MRARFTMGAATIAIIVSLGCYHAVADTGRPPNGVQIEKRWAHSFIAGLVPPSVVETAEKCPDGIAKVETRLSFLNQVANFLTLGIYSPMEIVVSCAGSSSAANPADGLLVETEEGSGTQAIQEAVELARSQQRPIYVQF